MCANPFALVNPKAPPNLAGAPGARQQALSQEIRGVQRRKRDKISFTEEQQHYYKNDTVVYIFVASVTRQDDGLVPILPGEVVNTHVVWICEFFADLSKETLSPHLLIHICSNIHVTFLIPSCHPIFKLQIEFGLLFGPPKQRAQCLCGLRV